MNKAYSNKIDRSYDLNQLVPKLLEKVPEIAEAYAELKAQREKVTLLNSDYEELDAIRRRYGLPIKDPALPGMTIVLENLLVPKIVEMVDNNEYMRLVTIFEWIEELANSRHFAVSNLVAGSLCLPLVTNYSRRFSAVYQHMGKQTIVKCEMVAKGYRVSTEVLKVLGLEK